MDLATWQFAQLTSQLEQIARQQNQRADQPSLHNADQDLPTVDNIPAAWWEEWWRAHSNTSTEPQPSPKDSGTARERQSDHSHPPGQQPAAGALAQDLPAVVEPPFDGQGQPPLAHQPAAGPAAAEPPADGQDRPPPAQQSAAGTSAQDPSDLSEPPTGFPDSAPFPLVNSHKRQLDNEPVLKPPVYVSDCRQSPDTTFTRANPFQDAARETSEKPSAVHFQESRGATLTGSPTTLGDGQQSEQEPTGRRRRRRRGGRSRGQEGRHSDAPSLTAGPAWRVATIATSFASLGIATLPEEEGDLTNPPTAAAHPSVASLIREGGSAASSRPLPPGP